MKKNKSKHKRKDKPKCPHGGEFGYDTDDLDACETCQLYKKCVAANDELTGAETIGYGTDEPQKKKPTKKAQDGRGAYIPYVALGRLLRLTNRFCVNVYLFIMKRGIEEETNQPWCNNNYIAKGLGCNKHRARLAKKELAKHGYITIIRKRDKKGRLGKEFIKLKYFPSKKVIEKAEYLRRLDKYRAQLDEYVEEFYEWVRTFTSLKMKAEIKYMKLEKKYMKLRRKYKKLKRKVGFQ